MSRDPVARYGARHSITVDVAHRLGRFRVYNHGLFWPDDPDFQEAWLRFPETDGLIKDRKLVLWSMARSTASLPGHTAECGVYNGGSSWLMCLAGDRPPGWKHHMFDSFEGLSEPETRDVPAEDQTYRWAKHDLAVGRLNPRRGIRSSRSRDRTRAAAESARASADTRSPDRRRAR